MRAPLPHLQHKHVKAVVVTTSLAGIVVHFTLPMYEPLLIVAAAMANIVWVNE